MQTDVENTGKPLVSRRNFSGESYRPNKFKNGPHLIKNARHLKNLKTHLEKSWVLIFQKTRGDQNRHPNPNTDKHQKLYTDNLGTRQSSFFFKNEPFFIKWGAFLNFCNLSHTPHRISHQKVFVSKVAGGLVSGPSTFQQTCGGPGGKAEDKNNIFSRFSAISKQNLSILNLQTSQEFVCKVTDRSNPSSEA